MKICEERVCRLGLSQSGKTDKEVRYIKLVMRMGKKHKEQFFSVCVVWNPWNPGKGSKLLSADVNASAVRMWSSLLQVLMRPEELRGVNQDGVIELFMNCVGSDASPLRVDRW